MSVTTLTLVRHHDAYRHLAKWTLVTLFLATAWLGVVTRLAGGDATVDPWALLATMWFGPALHLVAGPGDRRCRDLLLTLPLGGRRLWLANLLATGAASGAVLAVTLVVTWAGLIWLNRLGVGGGGGIAALREHLGAVSLQVVSWWILLLVALQARRPGPGPGVTRARLHPGDRRCRHRGGHRRGEPGPPGPGDGQRAGRPRGRPSASSPGGACRRR